MRGARPRNWTLSHAARLAGCSRMPLVMAIPTAIRTRPPISSPRSPTLVPSRSPSSTPARDKVTLAAPMMTAAAAATWRHPGEADRGLSMLSAIPVTSSSRSAVG